MLLHPYLSLHLFDLLSDVNVRGLVFGATNALFRQKSQLVDVVVEVSHLLTVFCDLMLLCAERNYWTEYVAMRIACS
jgi:Transport protein Avl9